MNRRFLFFHRKLVTIFASYYFPYFEVVTENIFVLTFRSFLERYHFGGGFEINYNMSVCFDSYIYLFFVVFRKLCMVFIGVIFFAFLWHMFLKLDIHIVILFWWISKVLLFHDSCESLTLMIQFFSRNRRATFPKYSGFSE